MCFSQLCPQSVTDFSMVEERLNLIIFSHGNSANSIYCHRLTFSDMDGPVAGLPLLSLCHICLSWQYLLPWCRSHCCTVSIDGCVKVSPSSSFFFRKCLALLSSRSYFKIRLSCPLKNPIEIFLELQWVHILVWEGNGIFHLPIHKHGISLLLFSSSFVSFSRI